MTTRKFILYNKFGDMIDFLDNLDIFGINPEGLGVNFDNDYFEVASNFLVDTSRLSLGQFKIQVAFGAITKQSYRRYDDLINLLNHPPYTLEYSTPAGTWTRTVRLSELTKSEIKENDIMIEDFVLDLVTPWYKLIREQTTEQPEQDGDGKIYKLEETPIYNPVTFLDPPVAGYEVGDLWKWDINQYWQGMNFVRGITTPAGNVNVPTIDGLYQYGSLQIQSFDNNKITMTLNSTSTDAIVGLAGHYANRLPIETLDRLRGQSVTAFATNIESNCPAYLYLYIWRYVNTNPSTIRIDAVKGGITKLQTVLPEDLINLAVVVRGNAPNLSGEWISFRNMGLQIENDKYSFNPRDLFGQDSGTLKAVRSSNHLNVIDWVPVEFDRPPINQYKKNDIWTWNEDQIWYGMNRMRHSVSEWESGVILSTGVFQDSELYIRSKNLIPVLYRGMRLRLRINKTPYQRDLLIAIRYFDSSGKFLGARDGTIYPEDSEVLVVSIPPLATHYKMVLASRDTFGGVFDIITPDIVNQIEVMFSDVYSPYQICPFDILKSTSGKFVATKSNNAFDFNDFIRYASVDTDVVSMLAYNQTFYYDYIYGNGEKIIREHDNIYAYIYDYIYEGWGSGSDGVFVINNKSRRLADRTSSPIEITINGPSVNPSWQVVSGSKILQSDGFNITIPEGSRLVVSSVPNEQKAVFIDDMGNESNVYQQQRLDLTNFVTIPYGNSQLVFFNCKKVSFVYREESVVV